MSYKEYFTFIRDIIINLSIAAKIIPNFYFLQLCMWIKRLNVCKKLVPKKFAINIFQILIQIENGFLYVIKIFLVSFLQKCVYVIFFEFLSIQRIIGK